MTESGTSFLNNTRIVVKSSLLAVGGTTTIELLEKDYIQFEDEPLPYRKLGFVSSEAFLRSLSDIVRVEGHGRSAVLRLVNTSNSKTEHLQQMIRAQKPDRKFKERFQRSASRSHIPQRSRVYMNQNATQYPKPVRYMSPQFPFQVPPAIIPTQVLMNMVNPYHVSYRQQLPQYSTSTWGGNRSVNAPPERIPTPPAPPVERPKTPVRPDTPPESPKKTSPVRVIPVPTPKPKTPPPVVNSIIDDEFEWATGSRDTICPPPGFGALLSDPSISASDYSDRVAQISEDLDHLNLTTSVEPAPALSELDFADFSIEASGGDEQGLPDWVYEVVQLVPKDMAGYKDVIMENERIDVLKIGKWTGMFVTEVHNPHKFFFQTEVEEDELANLMNNLRILYSKQSSDKLTPREHEIKCNMLVAALYGNIWHRGRVISEPFLIGMKTLCKVYYVDYGTVDNVPVENVRFLHKRFLKIPQLCHRGSLSGVLPISDKWSPRATKYFLAHVCERKLMALAHFFYAIDRSWHVEIVDPARNPVVNINIELTKEIFAVDIDSDDLEEYLAYYKKHPPTFDALVNGQFPTYSELLEYERVGIEFEPEDALANGSNGVERVMYLNEKNPFIESLREMNIRVITIPSSDTDKALSSSPSENDLSHFDRKDIPLHNINIPFEKTIKSACQNPFLLHPFDD